MVTGVIELNDSGICLTTSKQSWTSPGFATTANNKISIGQAALEQARLHPLNTFNQFWNRLSLDSINSGHERVRHHADLAFMQLNELIQRAGDCDEVIFAIPANFSSEQLSLLLGICQECSFNAVGLVDNAIAALASEVAEGEYLHVDIQLHQAVITRIAVDKEVRRQQSEIIPEAGLVALYEHWAKLISDQFIQQTRFDPRHTAEAEQQLFNHLASWLNQPGDDLNLELAGHKIKLSRLQLVEHCQLIYQKILSTIRRFNNIDTVFVSHRVGALPGFKALLPQSRYLGATQVSKGCFANEQRIRSSGQSLNFITHLPATGKSRPNVSAVPSQSQHITHLLIQHRAWSLDASSQYIQDHPRITFTDNESDALCCLVRQHQQLLMRPMNGHQAMVNGRRASSEQLLHPGDKLTFEGSLCEFSLITVMTREQRHGA